MAVKTFTQRIRIKLFGAKKAAKGTNKVGLSMRKLAKSASIAGAAYFGAQGIINGFKQSIDLATKAEALSTPFDNLNKAMGGTSSALSKYRKALDGTVNDVDLMRMANQAMTLGVASSEEEMAQLFDTAQRLGKSLGVDTKDAVDSLVTGMGRQSIMMLDNLGIIVSTEKANEDYAASIGKTVSQLTDQEKKIAFNNAALDSATEKVAALGDEQLTTSDAIAQMSVASDGMFQSIGEALSPAINTLTGYVKSAAGAVGNFFKRMTETDLETRIRQIQNMGGEVLGLEKILAEQNIRQLERDREGTRSAEQLQATIQVYEDKRAIRMKRLEKVEEDLHKNRSKMSDDEIKAAQYEAQNIEDAIAERDKRIKGLIDELTIVTQLAEEKKNLEDINARITQQEQEDIEVVEVQNQQFRKNNDLKIESVENAELEIATLSKLSGAYNKVSAAFGDLTQAQVASAMSTGAAFKSAGDAAGAAAGQFIVAKAQEAVAAFIADSFKKFGIFGAIGGVAAGGVVGSLMQGAVKEMGLVKAAEGFDGVVTEPTLFLAGEAGAEYVDIEPTNNEGANRGSGTVIFQGNVLSRDFIEDEAIPLIQDALRKGGDIGIG
tara:strand:+ start:2414 stop:4231 length:1818 start_codon:yes stop_codon:yes gene_type:complete